MRFYIPRHFTWLCCLCGRRRFPRAATHRLCDAVRHVTRVQLSLNNLFEDGLNEFMVEVFAEHLPVALVPRLVKAISDVLMVRIRSCASPCLSPVARDTCTVARRAWGRMRKGAVAAVCAGARLALCCAWA